MQLYGYIRVSSKDQNPERQLLALREQQIPEKNIYMDKISGKDFERPQYKRMMKKLKNDDVVIIKSIDRLGRNYDEILKQWRIITKEIGASIRVLDMPLLNTDTVHESLTGTFISDLVLQILAYVAETERSFIRQRQAEGIKVAQAKGVRFGARRINLDHRFEEYYEMWKQDEINGINAAKALGISTATFYRRCKEKDGLSNK